MKYRIDFRDLEKTDFLVLSMALRALNALRLEPRPTLSDATVPDEVVGFMNQSVNGFTDMCRCLDLVIDEPYTVISRLLNYVDLAAGEDVYQSFYDELKYINTEQPSE